MDLQSKPIEPPVMGQLDFHTFQQTYQVSKEAFCRNVYQENRDAIQIKKEKTVVKNLARIFEATFRICSRKGFRGMSMRDLSQESGLSMGGLYAYFRSKDELLNTLQRVGNSFVQQILVDACQRQRCTYLKLKTIVKVHLYLSEIVQAWFFFSYMEAKSMNKQERDFYKESELYTESLIHDTLRQGAGEGVFQERNHQLAASVIKAMLQDWYLKRWKYAKRGVTVDQYADFVLDFIEAYYVVDGNASNPNGPDHLNPNKQPFFRP